MYTLAFLEGFGSPIHWIIFLFIALLIFGRRLPEVGRSLGKGITEFKKGLKDATDEVAGQPMDPYQQGAQANPYAPPARPPQGYQQPYAQQMASPPPPPAAQTRLAPPPPMGVRADVRVTRNDMVD